ncbi:ABC transporter ATP-binding protein [Eupransor demetentiae]|uniref:ATPase component (OpuBA) n=1 Tax=Eupransor demetentiae TaxID=3109584 RepID=A0ABM9N327_9LACO|nr:ABC-type proline/glycine betaine transport system [Lactobacillaceae bacterium LMG 33000]
MISLINVHKNYVDKVVLDKINFEIASHEFFVLVGPSGSGKTTLLKMINRLNEPSSGRIEIDGQDVKKIEDIKAFRRGIGYVLQSGALFPNLTVAQNIAVTLDDKKYKPDEQNQLIASMLKRVDLDPATFMQRYPNELSGGEAQRVGIVRALIFKPNIMLMDEPFSALDPLSRRQLQNLLLDLHREFKTTIVFVTHDMQEALKLGQRVAILHEGEIQQIASPREIMAKPANDFVRNFFAEENPAAQNVENVIAAGFAEESVGQRFNISASASLADLAAALQKAPDAIVQVDDWQISKDDVLNYLAANGGEAAHE